MAKSKSKPSHHPIELQLLEEIGAKFAADPEKYSNMGSTQKVFQTITEEMLANNPFCPPKNGCPINDLPPEILAYIFELGWMMEDDIEDNEDAIIDEIDELTLSDSEDEEDVRMESPFKHGKTESNADDDEEEEEEDLDDFELPFSVLVSGVCKAWRRVALSTPSLWTRIHIQWGYSVEKAKAYVERSNELPLDITIDLVDYSSHEGYEIDDDDDENSNDHDHSMEVDAEADMEPPPSSPSQHHIHCEDCEESDRTLSKEQVAELMDIILPELNRWQSLDVTTPEYSSLYPILERLSKSPSAPILKSLTLTNQGETGDEGFERFFPAELNTSFRLFSGELPQLETLCLFGVHVDWTGCLGFFNHLVGLELAYHSMDTRPTMDAFRQMMNACSSTLQGLELVLSGPPEPVSSWATEERIELPALKTLVISFYEPHYIEALYPLLYVPQVKELALSLEDGDFDNFAKLLTKPQAGHTKPILTSLQKLKISGLPCSSKTRAEMLELLENMRGLQLNCVGEDEDFLDKLMELRGGGGHNVKYCPNLNYLAISGSNGKKIRAFVELRKQGGARISTLEISEADEVDEKDRAWLEREVDLNFFEPSDSEYEESVVDEEMESDVE